MKNRPSLLILGISSLWLILLVSCGRQSQNSNSAKALDQLLSYMVGSFNSAEQAAQDSSYYNISLHMYPVWEGREGNWLYVEQALNSMQDKPYRQRFYKVEQNGEGSFVSRVFKIKDEKECIGKWKTPSYFDDLPMEEVLEKEGCEVYLKQSGNTYSGKTKMKACRSSLRGASYATSEVTVMKDRVVSWDQGWNNAGEQVWGATKGGYTFLKLK